MRIAVLFAVFGLTAATTDPVENLRASLQAAANQTLTAGTPTTRDLANAALVKLATGAPAAEAEALLNRMFETQDLDPKSQAYGTVPWQIGHPEIVDANAVEFAFQAVGPVLRGFGSKLSDSFRESAAKHVRAALAAIDRHKVPASYTNIFLMKTVNLILLGEAISDTDSAEKGYLQLGEWTETTHLTGVHEYASPVYYAVDLNSLAMGYRYAKSERHRGYFKDCLEFLWSDIAANFLKPHGLSGPHSRDYDFLFGTGMLDGYLYLTGLLDRPPAHLNDLQGIYALLSAGEAGYKPAPETLALARQPERMVMARWDREPDHDRTNYVTPDFAIGVASGDYGPQDKVFAVDFATPKEKFPTLSVVVDATDEPFGLGRVKDRSGHNKPVHLKSRPVSLQKNATVLATFDVEAPKGTEGESLGFNLILPARADQVFVGGQKVNLQSPVERRLQGKWVLGIREGKAAAAVRLLVTEGATGSTGAYLKADAASLSQGAARIAVYGYRGPRRSLAGVRMRAMLIAVASKCESDKDFQALLKQVEGAQMYSSLSPQVWTAAVLLGGSNFDIQRDNASGKAMQRSIDLALPSIPALQVNRKSFGSLL